MGVFDFLTHDYGVTEAVGNILGIPNDPNTGKSQLLGPTLSNNYNPAPASRQYLASRQANTGGTVQGAKTSNVNWQNAGSAPAGTNTITGDPSIPDQTQAIKDSISSAWDTYTNSLGDTANTYLPQQSQSQQDIANSQLTQGQNTINTQKAASLRDIASNTRNAFQAGNIYLGNRGAGDSSAANQYAFATQQEANKQSGQLNEFVNGQLQTLQSDHDQKISQIANWFSEKQMEIKNAIASGQLQKQTDINNLSTSLLNNAIQAANQVKADASTRYNGLMSWAANNSTNLQQLGSNIRGIPQAMSNIQVDSSGNIAQSAPQVGISDTRKYNSQ